MAQRISLSWWDQHRIIQCPFSYENKFFMSNNKKAIVTKCDQKWDIYIKQRNRNYQYTTSITQMPPGKWQWTSIKKLPHTIKAVSTSPQQQHLINNETQDDPNPQQQINEYIDISTIPTHLFTSTDGSFIPNLTTSHGLHISDKQGTKFSPYNLKQIASKTSIYHPPQELKSYQSTLYYKLLSL